MLLWNATAYCLPFAVNVMLNPLTAEWALRALIDFTLSNARRFYSSMGNPLAGKGLTASKTDVPINNIKQCFLFYTQSVMLSPRFIPESVFYTQSVVRSQYLWLFFSLVFYFRVCLFLKSRQTASTALIFLRNLYLLLLYFYPFEKCVYIIGTIWSTWYLAIYTYMWISLKSTVSYHACDVELSRKRMYDSSVARVRGVLVEIER